MIDMRMKVDKLMRTKTVKQWQRIISLEVLKAFTPPKINLKIKILLHSKAQIKIGAVMKELLK